MPIFLYVPLQMISAFLDIYGVRGTALILAALTLHAFLAAQLLQPVKWHYRQPLGKNYV